jgi:hypothetical protein
MRNIKIFRSLFVTFNNGGRAKMRTPSRFSLVLSIVRTGPGAFERLANVWCPSSGFCGLRGHTHDYGK